MRNYEFRRQLARYERLRRHPADRRWRALIYLATSSAELWGILQPRLDYATEQANFADFAPLPIEDTILIDVAKNLFTGRGCVDLLAVAGLREDRFAAVMNALDLYRNPVLHESMLRDAPAIHLHTVPRDDMPQSDGE